MLKIVVG